MIHLVLGTQAQYIKTVPVLWELDARRIPYRLIDTGQHAEHVSQIRQEFGIRPPDLHLRQGADVVRLGSGVAWMARWFLAGAASARMIRWRFFDEQGGVCLVHGDTASTWLGAWLAKRAGLKVAHLEAGLRSFHPFSPFPEEAFRWMTTHVADLLLAPSAWAVENLKRMRPFGKIVLLGANTGMETVQWSLRQGSAGEAPWPNFAVATIHRLETLYSRPRLRFIIQVLLKAAESSPVVFLLHEPTRLAMKRMGFLQRLATHPKVRCRGLAPHSDFLHLLQRAQFVMTDGGSVQEESFYLNVPCLILRDRTERPEGLLPPGNAYVARWDMKRVEHFLRQPEQYRHRESLPVVRPSVRVVEALQRLAQA